MLKRKNSVNTICFWWQFFWNYFIKTREEEFQFLLLALYRSSFSALFEFAYGFGVLS